MCGVNGFNFEDKNLLSAMNQATKQRGPDGTGEFFGAGISLGHNLLAITEKTENSRQPFVSPDKNFALSFNGEIYNYKILRKELEAEGDIFATASDTEVLFKGLMRHGEAFISELDGMFAFAFYNKQEKTVLLARDSAGMKPMYYYHKDGKFIFSSEQKGILTHGISPVLEKEAARVYFSLGYVPGMLTLFKDINKISPGQCMVYNLSENTLEKKWFVRRRTNEWNPFDPDVLRWKIGDSVRAHMMGLRPFGLFLSGGIDSSIILHELSRVNKDAVKTYTTRFDIPDGRYNEDADFAQRLSANYCIDHHEFLVTEKDFMEAIEPAIFTMEEPRFNPSVAAHFLLMRHASKDIVVCMNGSGGDELFLGYRKYHISKTISARYEKYPHFLLNVAHTIKALRDGELHHGHFLHLDDPVARFAYLNKMKSGERMFQPLSAYDVSDMAEYLKSIGSPVVENPTLDMENAVSELDRFFWLADEEFLRTDKIAMHFGMEGRFPLLAKNIVEYAASISSREKFPSLNTPLKHLLRLTYRGHLPDYIIDKKKTGWNAPVAKWMRGEFGEMVKSILSKEYYGETAGVFDFEGIKKDHITSRTEFTLTDMQKFLPIFFFQIWARRFNIKIK